ncbi:hypothetical protein GCM10007049_03130 [Echinicola pacifica]|uniref:Uncharacterized protein n=1 Tax=Echinicola pacifica TaxID=346377 RepID=A0A918PMB5_9BACT|nr:hypothetical protein [Echinicola pacifica]GGZ14610.1 hypothetical protein GCM10007049_03130 [Echinicola pacifica]
MKTIKTQNRLIGLALAGVLVVFVACIWLSFSTGWYGLAFIAGFFIMMAAPFVDTPIATRKGRLTYYSPMFITENLPNGSIHFHGGTLFDYVYVINFDLNGPERTRFILASYLSGLINFIDHHKNTNSPPRSMEGTSYILQENTARKLGFKTLPTNQVQLLVLILNYPTLILTQSLASKRLRFPNLRKVRTYHSSLDELIAKEEFIRHLRDKLTDQNEL